MTTNLWKIIWGNWSPRFTISVRLLCLLIEMMTKKKKRIMLQLMILIVGHHLENQKSKIDDISVCWFVVSSLVLCSNRGRSPLCISEWTSCVVSSQTSECAVRPSRCCRWYFAFQWKCSSPRCVWVMKYSMRQHNVRRKFILWKKAIWLKRVMWMMCLWLVDTLDSCADRSFWKHCSSNSFSHTKKISCVYGLKKHFVVLISSPIRKRMLSLVGGDDLCFLSCCFQQLLSISTKDQKRTLYSWGY